MVAHTPMVRFEHARDIATAHGLAPISFPSSYFALAGFYKHTKEEDFPVIYIEGDGFAWIDRNTPSPNPTPRFPVALKLAAVDTSDAVFYLARPCQYVTFGTESLCAQRYWTSHRFAPEILTSYHNILDTIKTAYDAKGFHLVGFSGGGAIATLLSQAREDVVSLRTVAGNLDHVALHNHHKVNQLHPASANPYDQAGALVDMPQIHYSGGKDRVIPSWISYRFARKFAASHCIKTHIVPGATHTGDAWQEAWKSLHHTRPECGAQP